MSHLNMFKDENDELQTDEDMVKDISEDKLQSEADSMKNDLEPDELEAKENEI